jgi:hypothetical protein
MGVLGTLDTHDDPLSNETGSANNGPNRTVDPRRVNVRLGRSFGQEDEMIEAIIGFYLLAWWGVFMLIMPQRSLVRVWAFVPAAACAFGIPIAVWDFVRNPDMAMVLLVCGALLPFGFVAVLLIRRWKKPKRGPNQAVHAIGAAAPQHDG